jgi:rSAM-partnered protein
VVRRELGVRMRSYLGTENRLPAIGCSEHLRENRFADGGPTPAMVERPERSRTEGGERAPTGREWEVFVRDAGDDPMRHAGSVRARGAETAHELASRLFAWYATDIWVCPAEEMSRFSTHGAEGASADVPREEPRTTEGF